MVMILSEFCTMEPSVSLPHFQGYFFSLLKVAVIGVMFSKRPRGMFCENMIINSKLLKLDS